jgi:galactose oxidase-like protein
MTGPTLASHDLSRNVVRRAQSVGMASTALALVALAMLIAGNLPVSSRLSPVQPAPLLRTDEVKLPTHTRAADSGPTPAWRQISTGVAPSPRYGAQIAYDARDGYTVLYGGFSYSNKSGSGTAYDDTWTYLGGVWTNLSISGPSARLWESMAYDPADGYVVLFGGYGWQGTVYSSNNQTWIFSSGAWSQLDVAGPPPEAGASFAWDPDLGAMILSGGAPEVLGDAADMGTWSFVHGVWTNLSAARPLAADLSAMAYVPSAGGLILFGGDGLTSTGNIGSLSGTWLFDGEWKNLSLNGPTSREASQMAFEPSSGSGVLFGGWQAKECLYESCFATLGDTWIFNGASWTQFNGSGPPPLYSASMAYDAADGYDLLFGGTACQGEHCRWPGVDYNETWAFSMGTVAPETTVNVTPSAVCVFGDNSCAAGTWIASVNISVQPVYDDSLTGVAALTNPILTVLPWDEIEINLSSRPVVECESNLAGPDACDVNITDLTVDNASGFQASWSSDPFLDSLYVGQTWSVKFSINVAGPPYGSVPVYACTTGLCLASGSATIDGSFSCVSVQPLAAPSESNDSLPYANVTVDPPRILPPGGSSAPITTVPSAPPPPTGLPGPVILPSPVSIPTPVLVALAVSVPTVSISAAAAGILSAGVARVILQRRAVAVGQPVGNAVRGKRSAFEDERPSDGKIGRFD